MKRPIFAVGLCAMTWIGGACGQLMTEPPPPGDDFESPFEGLSADLNAVFVAGDENFAKAFTIDEGLGPIFNNVSCEGCHPGDGRGTPAVGFFRFSEGEDLALDKGGAQHQDKSIPGAPPEMLPPEVDRSFRIPPPVFGVGLIEAIPVETILAREDPDDTDGDGISGRAHWVSSPDYVSAAHVGGGDGIQLGRFSRKAQVSSLLQQVVEAYHEDIGITSDFLPEENSHAQAGGVALGDQVPDPEISAATVLTTVMYVRLLAPPKRGPITPQVERGEALFHQAQCHTCHAPTMRTGASSVAALSYVDAHLYSDLLLHDMGEGLADNRPDGDATGREWRTAPLWGLRLVPDFLGGQAFYMHDGQSTTLHDAIVRHGGESAASRDAYMALDQADQEALVAFLESL